MEEIPKVAKGFDKDLDYIKIKNKFINELNKLIIIFDKDKIKPKQKNICGRKIVYLLCAMIQLLNGSRCVESISAFKQFITIQEYEKRVIVKIAKSDSTKINKNKVKIKLKPRYREMKFPTHWIPDLLILRKIKNIALNIFKCNRLTKRVLDYLSKTFNCNTHSLRYAFINYMLYEKKIEMPLVAKFVGHSSVGQLVRYTQLKNTNKLFDLDA
jgi:site-specific recombinase XerD